MRATLIGAALWALAACTGGTVTPVQIEPRADVVPPATLGPGDVFEVRVYGEDELTGVYRVGSDGTINFPLIGVVQVEGLTTTQVTGVIGDRLRAYLKAPHVSTFVKEYNSKKIYVFGQVQKPGTFPFEEGMNIIQAITLAGGFSRLANKNDAFVTRIVNGREQRVQVSVRDIGEGRIPNFELRPGDIVFVSESLF